MTIRVNDVDEVPLITGSLPEALGISGRNSIGYPEEWHGFGGDLYGDRPQCGLGQVVPWKALTLMTSGSTAAECLPS